ncbi:MAG: hypothetical protein M1812_003050 [Candelaria pacifica]|nr:MAG: hypothetical protein M1812_003050 [Candelaria pacifica]
MPRVTGNYTIPDELCTLQTCTLDQAHFSYLPSLAGNVLYLAIFSVLIISQIGLGVFYRTWGFAIGMFFGLVLEIVGYVGRIQIHSNPFTQDPFLMYLVSLTIGPAFLSAAIYLCLARIIVVYGEHLSRFKPRTYTIFFMSCDFFSLLLQAIGGGIASNADTPSDEQKGINIMIAGLSLQVLSLLLFMVLCGEFAWRVYKRHTDLDIIYAGLRKTLIFKSFLIALCIATITVFVRSVFRVAELSQGFDGKLANDQVTFMILEGAMIIIAVTSLTLFHPGFSFQGNWAGANFNLRAKKDAKSLSEGVDTPESYGQEVELGSNRGLVREEVQ